MFNYSIFKKDNPEIIVMTNIGVHAGWDKPKYAAANAKCFVNQIFHPDTHSYIITED